MSATPSGGPATLIADNIDISAFTLKMPVEIGYVLRTLSQRNEFVTIFFNNGAQSMLSTIIDVDTKAQTLLLDWGSVDSINRQLMASERALCVSAPDGVKVQFVLKNLKQSSFLGKPAFLAAFPPDLIKLQRREFFRVETPITKPIKLRLAQPDGRYEEYALHDVSLGGVGIWLPAAHPGFELGSQFDNCLIDLGMFGQLKTTIEIRSVREIIQKNGNVQKHAGCHFVGLSSQQETLLQRYIAQLERERNLLR